MDSFENCYLRSSKKISKNCNKRTVNQWQRYKRLGRKQDYWWQL
jgi:hypothetical protein